MEYLINNLPDKFLLIIIVIIFSGFIRGFLGFGSGLITIPILSFIYSPIFAVVFNIIIEINNLLISLLFFVHIYKV